MWDTLQYLAPSLLATVVELVCISMLRPGAILLALFNAEERPGLVPGFSYRISDHRTILMSPRDERRPAQFFQQSQFGEAVSGFQLGEVFF